MPHGLLPVPAADAPDPLVEPQAVAEAFLAALAAGDLAGALDLVDDDIRYVNVGLPPVRGRRAVGRFLAGLDKPGSSFEVYLHAVSAQGPTVLTERTDVLVFGRLRWQFWVVGRFDVHDGRITLWRDAFDFVDLLRGLARGVAALVVPAWRPAPPSGPDAPPGR